MTNVDTINIADGHFDWNWKPCCHIQTSRTSIYFYYPSTLQCWVVNLGGEGSLKHYLDMIALDWYMRASYRSASFSVNFWKKKLQCSNASVYLTQVSPFTPMSCNWPASSWNEMPGVRFEGLPGSTTDGPAVFVPVRTKEKSGFARGCQSGESTVFLLLVSVLRMGQQAILFSPYPSMHVSSHLKKIGQPEQSWISKGSHLFRPTAIQYHSLHLGGVVRCQETLFHFHLMQQCLDQERGQRNGYSNEIDKQKINQTKMVSLHSSIHYCSQIPFYCNYPCYTSIYGSFQCTVYHYAMSIQYSFYYTARFLCHIAYL